MKSPRFSVDGSTELFTGVQILRANPDMTILTFKRMHKLKVGETVENMHDATIKREL